MPTISISLTEAFDIESYDGLVDYITALLELDTTSAAQIPTWIRLAEKRLRRLILTPQREQTATLATIASTQFVALPSDFRSMRTVMVEDDYPLTQVSLNVLQSSFAKDSTSGKPTAYTIADGSIYFGPIPDAVYSIPITYMADLTPIGATSQTNWLLLDNPDAYLFAALLHAGAFIKDADTLRLAEQGLEMVVGEINKEGNRYRNSGPFRLRSPVVV